MTGKRDTEAVLRAESLYRFFRVGDEETQALRAVSLTVQRGELVVIVGPSGSGKSTLLGCLAGLDEPDGGTVWVTGQRVSHQPQARRSRLRAAHIGMLYQERNLLAHLTVAQNVNLVRRIVRRPGTPDAAELLGQLGIADRAGAYPDQLSGGELVRAGLAVALANNPELVVADEPTGELDSATEAEVLAVLGARAAGGAAVLIASHSPAVAACADRVIALVDGRVS